MHLTAAVQKVLLGQFIWIFYTGLRTIFPPKHLLIWIFEVFAPTGRDPGSYVLCWHNAVIDGGEIKSGISRRGPPIKRYQLKHSLQVVSQHSLGNPPPNLCDKQSNKWQKSRNTRVWCSEWAITTWEWKVIAVFLCSLSLKFRLSMEIECLRSTYEVILVKRLKPHPGPLLNYSETVIVLVQKYLKNVSVVNFLLLPNNRGKERQTAIIRIVVFRLSGLTIICWESPHLVSAIFVIQ